MMVQVQPTGWFQKNTGRAVAMVRPLIEFDEDDLKDDAPAE